MNAEENYFTKSSMKENFRKKVSKTHKRISRSSDSSSSSDGVQHKKNKTRMKSRAKKRIHSTKHKHKKMRNRSSSSNSSSSVDTSTSSSSDTSSSSSTSEEERKRCKKRKHKLKKLQKKMKQSVPSVVAPEVENGKEDGPSNDIPLSLMGESRSMAPMTKEEWDKKQSVVRRVYDESTGRHRLIKGDGEVIEEIVSKERHKQINQQATKGDGEYFQKQLKQL